MDRGEEIQKIMYDVDWEIIKREYVAGIPTRELVAKYRVAAVTLQARARKENWLPKELRMKRFRKLTGAEKQAIREGIEAARKAQEEERIIRPITCPDDTFKDFLDVLGKEARKQYAAYMRAKDESGMKNIEEFFRLTVSDPEDVIKRLRSGEITGKPPRKHKHRARAIKPQDDKRERMREMILEGRGNKEIMIELDIPNTTFYRLKAQIMKEI